MSIGAQGKKLNEELSELQIKGDVYIRQMVMERKRIEDLDDAIAQADRQILSFQKGLQGNAVDVLNLHSFSSKKMTTADGWNPSLQGITSQKRMAAILENRLNKILVRQSQSEHENKQIKAEIDQLRRRRLTSNHNRRALEVKLEAVQDKVRKMLQKAATTSEYQRIAIENRSQLITANEDEATRFVESYKALGAYIQTQLKDFEESVKSAAKQVRNQMENMEGMRGELTITQEEEIQGSLTRLANRIDDERRIARETQDKISEYETAWEELCVAAQRAAVSAGMPPIEARALDNVDAIKDFYLRITDETFSLFTYNLEQIKEADAALERVDLIEGDRATYEEQTLADDAVRAGILRELQQSAAETKEQIVEYEQSANSAQHLIDSLGKKVQALFYKIQCDQISSRETKGKQQIQRADSQLLLASAGGSVTESNILQFMELIEQRAVEIMADFNRKAAATEKLDFTPYLSPNRGRITDRLQPPDSKDDIEADLDLAEKPLPLTLLRQRTAEKLSTGVLPFHVRTS